MGSISSPRGEPAPFIVFVMLLPMSIQLPFEVYDPIAFDAAISDCFASSVSES